MNNVNSVTSFDINTPLVSIAIITYNQKEFLRECIDSILAQDYKNIEIVVADDCSIDGTQSMLKEYNEIYPGKFVLKLAEKNLGITKNSNQAHFACTGKYVFWMGGDDLMLPNKIKKQVTYMENNPSCTVCYHNLEVFESLTNHTIHLMNNSKNNFSGDFNKVVSKGVFNGACSTVVRMSKTPVNGFDERIPIASDWLFWMQSLLNGGEINYIDEILGRYRKHGNNITNNLKHFNGQIDHLNSCNILLVQAPQYNKEILKRYAEIIRSLRIYDKDNFLYWILTSFKIRFNIKNIISLILYYSNLGKIKR